MHIYIYIYIYIYTHSSNQGNLLKSTWNINDYDQFCQTINVVLSVAVQKHLFWVCRFPPSMGSSMFSKHLYISSHITDLAITQKHSGTFHMKVTGHCYWHMPLILWMLQKMKINRKPQNSHPRDSYLSKSWYYWCLQKKKRSVYIIKVRSRLLRLQSFDGSLVELFDAEFHIINANCLISFASS